MLGVGRTIAAKNDIFTTRGKTEGKPYGNATMLSLSIDSHIKINPSVRAWVGLKVYAF